MKRYLLAGGAGFIGSNLAERLLADSEVELVIVDNLSLGREMNLHSCLTSGRAKLIKSDLADVARTINLFRSEGPFDAIFHLAANSDIQKSSKDPTIEYRNTFMTTFSILEAIRITSLRVSRFIFCSSSAIYGDKRHERVAESSGPYFPISYYGGAKLASEGFVAAYAHMNDINALILRFPNVVGDNATHGVIYDFITRLKENPMELVILGDGSQEKPYLYVKDLVEAIILAFYTTSSSKVEVYNIGVSSQTSVARIAAIVIEEMKLDPTKVKLNFTGGSIGWKGDVPRFMYDISHVISLGWMAKYDSDEAVRIATRAILSKWTQ